MLDNKGAFVAIIVIGFLAASAVYVPGGSKAKAASDSCQAAKACADVLRASSGRASSEAAMCVLLLKFLEKKGIRCGDDSGVGVAEKPQTTPRDCGIKRDACYDRGDNVIRDHEARKRQLVKEGKDLDDYEQELDALWEKASEIDRSCEPQFIACCEGIGLTAKKNTGRCEAPKGAATQPRKPTGTRVYVYDFDKGERTGEELIVPESKNHCLTRQHDCVTKDLNKYACNASFFERNPHITLEQCRKSSLINERRCHDEMVRCVKESESNEEPCKIKEFISGFCRPRDPDRLRKFEEFARRRYPDFDNPSLGSADKGGLASSPGGVAKMIAPGQLNTLVHGANSATSGAYQDRILQWLLSLRLSGSQEEKMLLDGFDFGPIQIERGAHQAVVVYEAGTDWRASGIVLDPWLEQKPKLYTINEWDDLYFSSPEPSTGTIGRPTGFYKGLFPTTPDDQGAWKYSDTYHARFIARNRTNGGRRIVIASPVNVLVFDDSGKSFGLREDGTFVNDFGSDVEGHILKASDGRYQTDVNLPDGAYRVKMAAMYSGDVHVYAATGNDVVEFEAVKVNKNDQLSLNWNNNDISPRMFNHNNQEVRGSPLTSAGSSRRNTLMVFVVVSIAVIGVAAFFFRRKKID